MLHYAGLAYTDTGTHCTGTGTGLLMLLLYGEWCLMVLYGV